MKFSQLIIMLSGILSCAPAPEGAGWLCNYEIPQVETDMPDGAGFSRLAPERFGNTYAYICDTPSQTQRVVTHTFLDQDKVKRNYTMLYDFDKRCALWVAYPMHAKGFADNDIGRHEDWSYDPAVPEAFQPRLKASYGDFTRGHQIASNDRQCSEAANQQTFYYTNMTPQTSRLNSGLWSSIEERVQKRAPSGRDTMYVVTGPVFRKGFRHTCNKNDGIECAVPTDYFKCIMSCSFDQNGRMTDAKGMAFLIGHEASAYARYTAYTKTIDEIEALTGFDFYHNIPETLQLKAESQTTTLF